MMDCGDMQVQPLGQAGLERPVWSKLAVCKQAAALKDIGGLSFCSLLMVANTHGVGTIETCCQAELPKGTCT